MTISSSGKGLVFILSQPRSGSTMLQRILAGHKKIQTASESWLMFPVLRILADRCALEGHEPSISRMNIQKFLNALPEGEEAYYEGMRRMYSHLYGEALKASGKEVFLDKVPRYAYVIPELYKTFPDAKYIFLLRHPFAVLKSIYHDWTGYAPELLSQHIYTHDLVSVPKFLVEGMRLLKNKAIIVQYEKLTAEPQQEIRRIVEALDLEFSPEIIEYGKAKLPKWNFGDFKVYDHDRPVAENSYKWKDALKDPLFWKLAENYLELLGKTTLSALNYNYEETQEVLKSSAPSGLQLFLNEFFWNLKNLISKFKKIPSQVRRHTPILDYVIHGSALLASFTVNVLKLLFLKLSKRSSGQKIAAIGQVEHFGDIVASEPVSRLLRQQHPADYLIWCVRKNYRELVTDNPEINQTISVCCMTEWIWLKNLKLFDAVFDLHISGRRCSVCRIPLKKQTGNLEINFENYYQSRNLLQIACESAGLPYDNQTPWLALSSQTSQSVDRLNLPKQFIVIHGLSNETSRDWENPKWHQLVREITRDLQIPVIEIGAKNIIQDDAASYINLCGKLSLLESAEVIKRAALFIGVDSGPAHLANAVGTPGVVLLGHYRGFERYCPYSGAYQNGLAELLYSAGPASAIPVETVMSSIKKQLSSKKMANETR